MFRINRTGSGAAGTKSRSRCWIAHRTSRGAGADIGHRCGRNSSFGPFDRVLSRHLWTPPMQKNIVAASKRQKSGSPDLFAISRQFRPALDSRSFTDLLRGWAGSKPTRGKLLGIEITVFILDTGRETVMESVHAYARKGMTWHRIVHVPARIDGSWRYDVRTGPREWAINVLRLGPGGKRERETVARIGGDSLREQYLRLPATSAPRR